MRERIGDDVALDLFLDGVIADSLRGAEGFFDVAWLEDIFHFLGMVGPDPGEEIGLQFEADGEFVVFGFTEAVLLSVDFVGDAEDFLDVVAYFVSDDIGDGEIARGFEAGAQFVAEGEVDVDFFIAWAIEGAGGGGGAAAVGLNLAGEEDELGEAVTFFSLLGKFGLPDVFGIGEDHADEAGALVFGFFIGRSTDLARGRAAVAGRILEEGAGVAT